MDPDATLGEIRRMVQEALIDMDADPATKRLAEHVDALDEWVSRGGFLPRVWRTNS